MTLQTPLLKLIEMVWSGSHSCHAFLRNFFFFLYNYDFRFPVLWVLISSALTCVPACLGVYYYNETMTTVKEKY